MKTERERDYSVILDTLQKIRGDIITESQEELMFTGVMPPAAVKELKLVADITAVVFNGLSKAGLQIMQNSNNPALVTMTIGEKHYSCLKSQLKAKEQDIGSRIQDVEKIDASESPMVKQEAPTLRAEDLVMPKRQSFDMEEPSVLENSSMRGSNSDGVSRTLPPTENRSIDEYLPQDQVYHPEAEESKIPKQDIGSRNQDLGEKDLSNKPFTDVYDEEPTITENYDNNKEEPFFAPVEEPVSEPVKAPAMEEQGVINLTEEDDGSSSVPDENIVEAPVVIGKAKIIGGGPVAVSGIDKSEFFIDEQEKAESEFVYCFSKISVSHTEMGGGGRPEEMLVLIAPLKIYKYASTSVPIVVTIVHNGKSVTASSYDILEEGKNIVTIDIDEFYFLCRGSFDDKGKFKASIVTTGISSQQNDRITPLFSKTYGNGGLKETRNGHIKFHYTADSGPGSIEVIPFGVQGDHSEDFIAIVKNKEFVDYYLVSKSLKASTRAIIYSEGGVMNELVCHWEDDVLKADLV